jgi:hypothetical protein
MRDDGAPRRSCPLPCSAICAYTRRPAGALSACPSPCPARPE